MRNHAPPPRSGSKPASDATRAFVRTHERDNKDDADPLRAALDALVERAATMALRESAEAERLRTDAHLLLTQLVAAGRLPAYMTIASDDALVVVIRMLAVVARRLNQADRTVHE